MGFVGAAIRGFRARSVEESGIADPSSWLSNFFGGGLTKAGVQVNEYNARNLAAVWACVRAIAEDCSKLPLKVYRRVSEDDRETVRTHAAWQLLNVQANADMTPAIALREYLFTCAQLWGNGFAEIERTRGGRPLNLWPMCPSRTQLRRTLSGSIEYVYRSVNGEKYLPAADVLHLRGPSKDGIVGVSVIAMARESLGAAMATDQFTSRFWQNGARPSGAITTKGKLSDAAIVRLRESIDALYGGANNAGRPILLEEEAAWAPFAVPPEDAQFLGTKAFQVDEICRWFRTPPHKVFKLDRATFSNIEHQSLEYVTDGLGAWMVRMEQECNLKLLSPGEVLTMYIEHLVDALLRGDLKTRYEAYGLGRQWGYLSVNDIRRRENMNRLPGDDGDQYIVPSNMTTPAKLEEAAAPGTTPPTPAIDPGTDPDDDPVDQDPDEPESERSLAVISAEIATAFVPLLEDVVNRLCKVEAERARRTAKQGVPALRTWIGVYYGERLDDARGAVFAGVEALARVCRWKVKGDDDMLAADLARTLAHRHVELSRGELLAAIEAGQVEQCLAAWESTRAARDAAAAVGVIADRIVKGKAKEGV